MIANVSKVLNGVRSDNFPKKNISEQELACRWT